MFRKTLLVGLTTLALALLAVAASAAPRMQLSETTFNFGYAPPEFPNLTHILDQVHRR